MTRALRMSPEVHAEYERKRAAQIGRPMGDVGHAEADFFDEREAKRAWRDAFNNGSRGRIVTPEREVQTAILRFLRGHPKVGFAVRMNSGMAKYRDGHGAERAVRFGFRGCPDLWACLRGGARLLLIEVKSRGGKATHEQRAVLDAVNAAGGIGLVAYSIDDVARALDEVA